VSIKSETIKTMPDAATARPTMTQLFQTNGVVAIEWALTPDEVEALGSVFGEVGSGRAGGGRSTWDPFDVASDAFETLAELATQLHVGQRVQQVGQQVGQPLQLVRVIAFDRTPETNWFVPWHQDRTIAVAQRVDAPGFEHWTIKDGVLHVEPPIELLERMVTLRVHLDACTEDDGALEVMQGSHGHGRLDRSAIDAIVAAQQPLLCLAERGDILAIRPLLVHRSQRAKRPTRRRVLHLEYVAGALPRGLSFARFDISSKSMRLV
jgi:Phytanoyl-CoA dioxygenase (PhyH)